jgi:hypothetical protein
VLEEEKYGFPAGTFLPVLEEVEPGFPAGTFKTLVIFQELS